MPKTFYQITKNEKQSIRNKTDKNWKKTWNNIFFGCNDFTHNFKLQEVKMTNKVLREKSVLFVCRSNNSRFLKQKQKIILYFTNSCYRNKMMTYCVKCRKDTENIDPKMVRIKNNRLIMQAKCPLCRIKKSRFVKEQEAKGLFSNLGIKTSLSRIPLLNVLF